MPGAAPFVLLPLDAQFSAEDVAWSFAVPVGTFDDPDADVLVLSATLASGDPLPAWLGFDAGTGTFTGIPPADFSGSLILRVTASDGTLSVDADFTLTIDPVNDRPILTPVAPAFATISEDAVTNTGRTVASLLGGATTDIDGDPLGIAVTGQNDGNGTWQFSLDNGATWSEFGSVSDAGALLLRATDRVRFLPDARNGTTAEFTYRAWDESAGSAGEFLPVTEGADSPFSAASDTASLTVTARNDAPVLTPVNPTFALIGDSGSVTTRSIASLIGTSITDVDEGALTPGIAVTGLSGNGTWQYSRNGGATWSDFGTVADGAARLLLSGDLVRFEPTSTTGGPASFSYVGWDRTSGSAGGVADASVRGGTTAFSLTRDIASISGNDLLVGGEGNDTLIGLSGDDTLIGNDGSDTLEGGSGDDLIIAGNGRDMLFGGEGRDTLYSGDGDALLDGGSGDDLIQAAQGFVAESGASTVFGGSGSDTIDAGNSTEPGNEIYGGDGIDRLILRGRDYLDPPVFYFSQVEEVELADDRGGLTLQDRNFTSGSSIHVFVSAANSSWTIDASSIQLGSLVFVSALGTDIDGEADRVSGGLQSDTISTFSGSDLITGGGGGDLIYAGTGFDTAIFSGNLADYLITEDNVNGRLIVTDMRGIDGEDTLVSVNRLQFADQAVDYPVPGVLLIGTELADTIAGGEGTDSLDGQGGDDTLIGNDGSDTLEGGSGDDSALGGEGEDLIETGDGNDTVDAGAGDDLIVGGNGAGNDRYTGGAGIDTVRYTSAITGILVDLAATTASGAEIGSDRLFQIENIIGGQGSDSIRGSAAANRLDGHTGADTLEGIGGNDTYVVDRLTDVVIEQAGGGTDTIIALVDALVLGAEVENLVLGGTVGRGTGNALNNSLTGNSAANRLEGGAGNDTLDGAGGADSLIGGAGNDLYLVDASGDRVYETTTTSSAIDAGGMDTIRSAIGFSLEASAGVRFVEDLVLLGTANTSATGNALANRLTGNAGDNTLDGGGGDDTMLGGAGSDLYIVASLGDRVFETTTIGGTVDAGGNDTIRSAVSFDLDASAGVRFVETLILTGTANSTASGSALANLLSGNSGANVLDGRAGADTMIGGGGNDRYIVSATGDQVFETTTQASTTDAGGTDTIESRVSFSLDAYVGVRFVEHLILTGTANTSGTGNALANRLTGSAGNNLLNGGLGADTMIGGAGNDIYVVERSADRVIETLDAGSAIDAGGVDEVRSAVTFSLDASAGVRFVENLTLTGTAAINAIGNALANRLIGNGAANQLTGGLGADTMIGGAGDDSYVVDAADDQVFETTTVSSTVDAGGVDLVRSAVSFSLATTAGVRFVENLTLTGAGNTTGTGNGLANILIGNRGANVLVGGAGADTMIGGAGNDIYGVTSTADMVFETTNATSTLDAGGRDEVQSSVAFNLDASAGVRFVENLVLTGAGNIAGTGNALANRITGNAANNVINGGLGADTLTGGSGSDSFVFSAALGGGNIDRITDFSTIDDTIRLDDLVFSGLATRALAASAFASNLTGNATDALHRVIYETDTGRLFFDADGNGSGARVQFATLSAGLTLTAADFFVV